MPRRVLTRRRTSASDPRRPPADQSRRTGGRPASRFVDRRRDAERRGRPGERARSRRYAWLWLTEPPSAWADRTGRYGRHVAGHPVQREVILTAARPGGRARSPDAATCARERGSYWWARWRRLIRAEHRLAAFGDGMRSTARSPSGPGCAPSRHPRARSGWSRPTPAVVDKDHGRRCRSSEVGCRPREGRHQLSLTARTTLPIFCCVST